MRSARSPRDVAGAIVRIGGPSIEPPWLRVVGFPAAGRGARAFGSWRHVLDAFPGVELFGAQLPGREARMGEACAPSMRAAADEFRTAIERCGIGETDVVFFGHSLGAYLAHAVAVGFHGEEFPLGALVVAAAPAPWLQSAPARHLFSDDELRAELAMLGATPTELLGDPDLLGMFLPTIRSDFELAETYQSTGAVDCPVLALSGSDDPDVAVASMAGWGRVTRHGFRHRTVPGGHFFPDHDPAGVLSMICSAHQKSDSGDRG